jgi:hypothetical protein
VAAAEETMPGLSLLAQLMKLDANAKGKTKFPAQSRQSLGGAGTFPAFVAFVAMMEDAMFILPIILAFAVAFAAALFYKPAPRLAGARLRQRR